MKSFNYSSRVLVRAALAVAIYQIPVRAGVSTNTSGPVQQGTNGSVNNPAVTISFSGQTALRTFDTSSAITELQPGTSIVLHNGTNGAPVTYIAPNVSDANVQLANPNFGSPDYTIDSGGNYQPVGTPSSPSTNDIQVNSAIRLEWHEQGSVDGFYDLLNDEVGYAQNAGQATANGTSNGPISVEAQRTPSSSNPTWINTNKFTAGGTLNSLSLDNSSNDILANTYSSTVYNQATGQNLLGGQNRIQFSVGEYPTEAFSVTGSASPFASAGASGYGQGNPALAKAATLTGLGVGGTRQQFQSSSIANESTAIDDPQTGTNYAAGPWNTAGANNLSSTSVAATAVTYSANPGSGLQRINKGDSQWLQTTGRLQNGALFNVVARTVDTGQRIVFALNTGVDPSWAVGSNDDGNSTSSTAATAQHSVGPELRFDGKTSGTEAEKTIASSRMAVGALSVPEARAAASNAPVRALDVDFNDLTDPTSGGVTNDSAFVRANFSTIVSSNSATRYQAVLISHYNTVKTPNQTALNNALTLEGIDPATATAAQQQTAWTNVQSFDPSTAETDSTPASAAISGIKGDVNGDVAAFLSNLVNSVATATNGVSTPNSANNPADGLLSTGFLLPGLLDWTRQTDGGAITPVTLTSAAQAEQGQAQANYGPLFTTDSSAGANSQTIGSAATYGAGGAGISGTAAINGTIAITAKNASGTSVANGVIAPGGNYLFGNFNQNGVRDYSAVQQSVNAALSLAQVDVVGHTGSDSIFTSDGGVTNSTVIPSLVGTPGWVTTSTNTKGDLITLGDYNGDGKFDGQDLYLLAIGASLADSTSSNTLTATAATFSDAVRNSSAVLRKNAALDYVNSYLSSSTATAAATYLEQSGRSVLSGATVPAGATDLHTQDTVTGLEQYTYDPTGAFAFNKHDVNRDGVIDLNDALLVDEYSGQSYTNLSQSLAATEQTPVSGTVEALSLVVVQQIDGEAAIGAADLSEVDTGLTGTGNANWYGYNVQKTGPGTIVWARTGGTVTIYSGASLTINAGTLAVGGSVDPFTDNSSFATAGTHLNITNNATLSVSGGTKVAGTLRGTGTTEVSPGATLSISSLQQSAIALAGELALRTNAPAAVINSISVTGAGQLDLGNTDLIITNSANAPLSSVRTLLANGGSGSGIVSSYAAAHPGTSLGSATAGELSLSQFDGQTVSPGAILIKYTWLGDLNLDGSVTASDLATITAHTGLTNADWTQGDLNYDNVVNADDFSLFALGSAEQTGQLSPAPEPAQIALLSPVLLLATRKRRENAVSPRGE